MTAVEEIVTPSAPPISRTPLLRRWASSPAAPFIALGALLIVLIIVNLLTVPVFGTWPNITNLMRTLAIPLLLAAAGTLVLLTGAVDLSAGAMLGLSGILYAQLVVAQIHPLLALVLTVVGAGLIGFGTNGLLIGRVGMSFFVVTLGMASVLRGAAFLWSDSASIDMSSDPVSSIIGNDTIIDGRIPVSIVIALSALVLLWIVLRYTTFGRSIYAVGGNRQAAELSGVRPARVIAAVYCVAAICAAIAGIMMIGRQTLADPSAGNGIELTVASGIMLGGVALTGGSGSIWGAALGTVFISVLSNSLALRGISSNWQLLVTGVILIIAVYVDRVRQRAGGSR